MKGKVQKTVKRMFVGFLLSFFVFTFNFTSIKNVKADESNVYFWSIDKSIKSYIYQGKVQQDRNKKLEDVLGVSEIDSYFKDIKSLYDLSVSKDKVGQVEKIINDSQKQIVSYEMYLLTGDKEMVEKQSDNDEVYFNFEMILG